jgi:serine/threonine protein kinase/formylglycine-generating enzyme required for sulfatase activity
VFEVESSADTFNESVEALARGEVLGRYIVLERLGVGAMGVVYAAYDPELDRKVAVKILRRQEGAANEVRRQARFVREAKAIAKLAHPNAVGIFDVGVDHGRGFLAMEYLAGGTLRAWLAAEKRPWREIVKMFVEVGRGLGAAHAQGLVHRDFKPDNVLLDAAGTPKVADFGMVRLSGAAGLEDSQSDGASPVEKGASRGEKGASSVEKGGSRGEKSASPEVAADGAGALTRTGTMAGTPAYMAPEQFQGKETDGRTDQFAFCVALHEALYGRRPFQEGTVFDLAEAVMREQILPPPKNTNVPGWVRQRLLRGLRADRDQRYAKLEDLLAKLQADPVARLRRILVSSVVALVVAGTFVGLYRRSERRRLEFEGRVASRFNEGRQALLEGEALDRQLSDARGAAFAAFDATRRAEGESKWADARAYASKLETTFKRAEAGLEAALALDQSNERAREALEDALFRRAALAELEFRKADLGHDLEQIERLDPTGRRMARWTRPGSIDVQTTPPGAHLVLERYEPVGDDGASRLVPVLVGAPFLSPSEPRPLPPGSYRLKATKSGFTEARLPFVVHRGERLRLDLPLVAASEAPPDFVYVPPGRFLYGDADEDWRLAFLNAAPIHERSTGAFFVKAHETTFGEWFEFLRDLPPAERRLRTPSSVAVQGSAVVEGSPDKGWSLELNISGSRVTARQGSPLVLPTRKTRVAQDWLRMPVIGISQRDMQAYVDWLARTGRVPGARFCTEVEWERAARGADGRSYPASLSRLAGTDANIDVTYGRVSGSYGPDEVGSHPESNSPFDIADLAGNVWEVVRASDDAAGFLTRGGAYYQASTSARATNREPIDVGLRAFILGLRVCAAKK